jgi:GAF domain-containing protein
MLAATETVHHNGVMFDFAPEAGATGPELYDNLVQAAEALVAGEPDGVANMANVAALIWQFVPDLNWAGFYRIVDGELVLGPFIGKPACLRIALGSGVCGTAALSGETQCVADVHDFPGHIACDAASESELVVPVKLAGTVIAVIDLDSPRKGRFGPDDARGIEALAAAIATAVGG